MHPISSPQGAGESQPNIQSLSVSDTPEDTNEQLNQSVIESKTTGQIADSKPNIHEPNNASEPPPVELAVTNSHCQVNRLGKPRPTKFFIDDVIAEGTVNIVVGETGVGKTSFVVGMLVDYLAGNPVFGRNTRVAPVFYVALDRGRTGFEDLLWRLSVPIDLFPWTCMKVGADEFDKIQKAAGNAELIVIDGIERLAPGEKTGNDVMTIMKVLNSWVGETETETKKPKKKKAIIGIAQTAKERTNSRVVGVRHQVIGSVYWGADSETMIKLAHADDHDQEVIVSIHPHMGAPFKLRYGFDEFGAFLPIESPEEALAEINWLQSLPLKAPLKATFLQRSAEKIGVCKERHFYQSVLPRLLESGQLIKRGRDYIKPF